jgi:hypothetical protein
MESGEDTDQASRTIMAEKTRMKAPSRRGKKPGPGREPTPAGRIREEIAR